MHNRIQECVVLCNDLNILYVEDNEEARQFTMEMLKRFFKSITVAADGEDGLAKFKENEFDMILTDINMPKMNGLEMAKEIKSINKSIPILILSAHNEENYFISSIQIGIDGYLLKPLEISQFTDTLLKSVEKIHLQKEIQNYQIELESSNANLEAKVQERTAELEHRLYHDSLTNLRNHTFMMKNIGSSSNETIFLIDINGFQKFNDIYGLKSGNTILKKFAQNLQDFNQNNNYTVYRVYGDGFVLQRDKASSIQESFDVQKEKLLNHFESIKIYLEEIEEDIEIEVTIGASVNEERPYIKADMALKHAKKNNLTIALYSEEMDTSKRLINDLYWKKEIKSALKNDSIIPVFQGIVDMSQNIVKYESLMRLKQDDNGEEKLISPFFFLDAAVNTRQYNKLTRIMVQKTFLFMQDKDIDFSINLSFEDLSDSLRVEFLHEQIQKHGVENRLILEILESETVSDYELVINVLKEFRDKGVRIAIDDFGSGYSNFEHILKLDPDFIKIDASLTKNILEDDRTYTLIKAICEFSHKLDIKVIAEFVSTQEIFLALKELGIDEYQGFYFSIPSTKLL
ncbi:EAL domain-containing protein [Sulfurimonas sp.]|uniref:EAL domain-containing response regulator n=1 Tax=Sulfurimonas sp. TaxID=2022749 RepID=UPI003562FFED